MHNILNSLIKYYANNGKFLSLAIMTFCHFQNTSIMITRNSRGQHGTTVNFITASVWDVKSVFLCVNYRLQIIFNYINMKLAVVSIGNQKLVTISKRKSILCIHFIWLKILHHKKLDHRESQKNSTEAKAQSLIAKGSLRHTETGINCWDTGKHSSCSILHHKTETQNLSEGQNE